MNGISGAVNRYRISSPARTKITTRCRVECGAGGPGAGHFSRWGLQAREHSAAIRAGTVRDGQKQQHFKKRPVVTIGDGRPTRQHNATNQRSRTKHIPEFAQHPARSARTRCIRLASALTTTKYSQFVSKRAGGHSGPPLRGDFASANPQSYVLAEQRDAGWNVERVDREPDISADGGCKQRNIRRLSGRAPSPMVITNRSLHNNPS